MSTHAEIFVETRRGEFTGTYVHFDGYPQTCGAGVACRSYQEIKDAVLGAQKTGGLCFVGPNEIEAYATPRTCIIPSLRASRERFVYVKRRSGTTYMYVGGVMTLFARAPKKREPIEPSSQAVQITAEP